MLKASGGSRRVAPREVQLSMAEFAGGLANDNSWECTLIESAACQNQRHVALHGALILPANRLVEWRPTTSLTRSMAADPLSKATNRSPMTRRTVLSLYTGTGGLDLGLEAAGFEITLCVENDHDCRSTLQWNRPGWRLSDPGDVHKLSTEEALRQANLKPGQLTLLAGGPPCQPFSKSSYWVHGDTRRLADVRAGTLVRYLDFVEAALPEALLLENVKGLVYNAKDEGLQLLKDRLVEINNRHHVAYELSVVHLNCAEYGVPQVRERVFIVAHREGGRIEAPVPTHGAPENVIEGKTEPYRTVWDAIGDLDVGSWPEALNPGGKWGDLLPSIPEGQNYLWHTPGGGGKPLFGRRTRYWSFLLKLAKDRPAWTIQAAPGPATGPFHWRSRHLSVSELCRLQTFPDDYKVLGGYKSQHRQIGNAVPPAIGHLLGVEIRRQLLGDPAIHHLAFIPPRRDDCPPPHLPESVPKNYYKYLGAHSAHPGVGKGPGALKRSEAKRLTEMDGSSQLEQALSGNRKTLQVPSEQSRSTSA